jgi:O-antigen/teichoic acid export membrane protein
MAMQSWRLAFNDVGGVAERNPEESYQSDLFRLTTPEMIGRIRIANERRESFLLRSSESLELQFPKVQRSSMAGTVSQSAALLGSCPEGTEGTKRIGTLALRITRGSLTYALANVGIKALNFCLVPLYTRFLSPADYGIVSLAETIAAGLAVVLSLGLDAGVGRFYFQYKGDSAKLSRYVSSCLRFSAIWTVLAVGLFLLLGPRLQGWWAPHFSVPFYPYIAMAIATAALLQIIQYRLSLYQVRERPRAYGLLTLAVFLATAAGVVVLVVFAHWGAFGMLLGKLWGAAIAAIAAIYLLRNWLGSGLEWKFVRETLPFSLPLVPHNLMALCLVVADRFILQHYRGLNEVGLYSLAYTLGMAMFLVSLSLGQAWQPIYFDTARGKGARPLLGKLTSTMALLLTAIAIFGVQIGPYFTRLLDARYLPIGRLIPWIIGGYLLHAFFGLFQLALLESKRTKFIVAASAAAFGLNLALNLWWIPRLGMYGAAYATFVAYGAEAILTYYYAQRVFFLQYDWRRIFAILALFALSLGLSQFGWRAYIHAFMTLGILLTAAAIVWFSGGQDRAISFQA